MARTARPGLSHEQKVELWRRWKAGEPVSDIGRALVKHAASVFGVMLVKVARKDSDSVVSALISRVRNLRQSVMASLTWDRGTELACRRKFTIAK